MAHDTSCSIHEQQYFDAYNQWKPTFQAAADSDDDIHDVMATLQQQVQSQGQKLGQLVQANEALMEHIRRQDERLANQEQENIMLNGRIQQLEKIIGTSNNAASTHHQTDSKKGKTLQFVHHTTIHKNNCNIRSSNRKKYVAELVS